MTIAAFPFIAVCLSIGLIAASEMDQTPLFVWNQSESVPVGLYVLRPSITPTLGNLAAVQLPSDLSGWAIERGYLGAETLLIKRVAATAEMSVCRDGLSVSINNTIVTTAAETDRNGRALPSWAGCVTLGPDEFFLLNADVDDSLDGRYFGTINASRIVGQALPIWTRGG
ncbi:S26 family signal peptidase [Gymnodinialimonas hymeniacidonis]|uniref:S26 family signal peptidase n=1 Tax=Gymnodinialimonas hymeniacidonis TaxID=3126508 RepID=UPI0034C67E71